MKKGRPIDPTDFEDDDLESYEVCDICDNEMEWETCYQCGGEGGRDGQDLMMEDPMWYGPDDWEQCDTCCGKGGYFVCPFSRFPEHDKIKQNG